ncbi:MAG: THUMP domain-containing protein [Candidatus Methanoplasma sp.]|jgi:thiamine biosynthesis protein ThiI|nr:THUMP domain-containing protein [Candidatus Methanoplasma sp.]
MPIIFARYSEIGLKSTPVRLKFENRLRDNMISMLASDRVEALITKKDARFYIETADIAAAISSLRRVFGISSLSVAEVCTSEMEDICSTMAEYSLGRLKEGESFAVKARREGNQNYKSMDVAREAGSAIFLMNESKGVKVDLTNPDVVFFIEVRGGKAFIFGSYVRCHGGLPVGTQGKVIAEVRNEKDIVSAWLMMKRGCKLFVKGEKQPLLERYDPELKYGGEVSPDILGIVRSTSFSEFDRSAISGCELPVFFPNIGMNDEEIASILNMIKNESVPFQGTEQ